MLIGQREEMAQRSLRRDQDNQLCDRCREHVVVYWTRSANSRPGPGKLVDGKRDILKISTLPGEGRCHGDYLCAASLGLTLPSVPAAEEQAFKLGLPFLAGLRLGWMQPVGSLDQPAPLSNSPLKVSCRFLAGKDL